MWIGTFFYLIYDILLWGSAAILVGSCYFIYYLGKFLLKLAISLGYYLESKYQDEEQPKTRNFYNVRPNRRVE